MAETQAPQKRTRDELSHEYPLGGGAGAKRLKPFDSILDLLDEDDETELSHELSPDLSAIFATLQKELFSSVSPTEAEVEAEKDGRRVTADEDDGRKPSVMRHLFEASDDELGIPNRSSTDKISSDIFFTSDLGCNDGGFMWELEDEVASYYTDFM